MAERKQVVLVNKMGRRIGIEEKLTAHRKGLLHRAFSIFIFDELNCMLLQQRAPNKYHFAGLWSNACCSHPQPNEKILASAKKRLKEELNIETDLKVTGHILYKLFDKKSNLTEHEFDYILNGKINRREIQFNPNEVVATRWISLPQLKKELNEKPRLFTPWFTLIMEKISRR